ncbi:MAG: sugar ABC transporter permease [Anaerolineaceae bacterium]|jgi:multiple sugar transport system permease protein
MDTGLKPLGKERWWLVVLLAPTIIGLVFGTLGSIIATTLISLTQWDNINPPIWVGFQNFIATFTQPAFLGALHNTLVFTALYVPGTVVASLVAALLLNRKIVGVGIFRTLYFLPSITSAVAVSLIFSWLYAKDNGLLNYMISSMGGQPINWLGTQNVMTSVVIANIWGAIGEGMVIFLAGLQAIPKEYYEAATVDGAGGWAKFLHLTLPLITPSIFFQTLITTINGFQAFEYIYMMTRHGNGDSSIPVVVFSIYRNGFRWFNLGGASAQALILSAIIIVLMLVYFEAEKRWVVYD